MTTKAKFIYSKVSNPLIIATYWVHMRRHSLSPSGTGQKFTLSDKCADLAFEMIKINGGNTFWHPVFFEVCYEERL